MKKRLLKRYKAFSIMEVTIVMVVTSIVVTLVFSSIIQFQKQLKKEAEIRLNLSKWHVFRTNLYFEFYLSKNTEIKNDTICLETDYQKVKYYLLDGKLMRLVNGIEYNTYYELNKFNQEKVNDVPFVTLDFIWQKEVMSLVFPESKDNTQRINNWFNELELNGD